MDFDDDYLVYRAYIDEFSSTIDLQDQLPVRVSGYCLREFEIHGEIIDWLISYLGWVNSKTLLYIAELQPIAAQIAHSKFYLFISAVFVHGRSV